MELNSLSNLKPWQNPAPNPTTMSEPTHRQNQQKEKGTYLLVGVHYGLLCLILNEFKTNCDSAKAHQQQSLKLKFTERISRIDDFRRRTTKTTENHYYSTHTDSDRSLTNIQTSIILLLMHTTITDYELYCS